jgi:hypothetical protein
VLAEMVSNLEPNQVILEEKKLLHFIRMKIKKKWISIPMKIEFNEDCLTVMNTWDIFSKNDAAIREDFDFDGRQKIKPIPKSVNVLGHENIFIEEGAKLEFVTLNALSGPIYIGKDAEIMEGSVIRGPLHCVKVPW